MLLVIHLQIIFDRENINHELFLQYQLNDFLKEKNKEIKIINNNNMLNNYKNGNLRK